MNNIQKQLLRLNNAISAIDPRQNIDRNPKLHIPLNPIVLTIRQELYNLQNLNTTARKRKLVKLYMEDFLQEEKELREVGLAYINIQQ